MSNEENKVHKIDEEVLFQRRISMLTNELLGNNRNVSVQVDGDGFLDGIYDNEGRRIEHKPDRPPLDETRGKVIPFKRR